MARQYRIYYEDDNTYEVIFIISIFSIYICRKKIKEYLDSIYNMIDNA